jgi:hypothetical protein
MLLIRFDAPQQNEVLNPVANAAGGDSGWFPSCEGQREAARARRLPRGTRHRDGSSLHLLRRHCNCVPRRTKCRRQGGHREASLHWPYVANHSASILCS